MTYWTILLITIASGPLDGTTTGLVYPSEAACIASHKIVADTFDGAYDYTVECRPGDLPSGSIKPKPRPWTSK